MELLLNLKKYNKTLFSNMYFLKIYYQYYEFMLIKSNFLFF